MTTPIIVLCLLLLPLLGAFFLGGAQKARLGGILGLAFAFAFFGVGHFVLTEEMTQMLPPIFPFATALILATGVLELTIAIGVLHPKSRDFAGLMAIAVLIAFFPVNIYAAFQKVGSGGHVWGPSYLLVRAPLQALLIWWTWFFVVRPEQRTSPPALKRPNFTARFISLK